jgi:hypothetical protein
MYACIRGTRRVFSRGCARPAMRPPIPATHPTHAQHKRTGAPLPGLQPVEGHAQRYRGRRFSLG